MSHDEWAVLSGGSCNDSQACTRNDQCGDGVCSGSLFSCKSCEYCNGTGCILKSGYCLIDMSCRNRGERHDDTQHSQCQVDLPQYYQ